ncbi:unnamed protein product [Soboliphyme baturini]|uniref:Galactosylgalactosylxylosylprotein 3-beta-glucuronosyltransferase n=1 Tax=Soboliphyme baturini TaxID=241478 RepID=A0A183J5S3_9BILA|nr:unnamed protein product [Soboliphyme baturini]
MSRLLTNVCTLTLLCFSLATLLVLLPCLRQTAKKDQSVGPARLRRSVARNEVSPDPSLQTVLVLQKDGPDVDLGQGTTALGKNVFITVKTTAKFHKTRVRDILDTWFRLAPDKVCK